MSTPIPRPGEHLTAASSPRVDPHEVVSEVDALLSDVDQASVAETGAGTSDPHGLVAINRQAQIIERAHDVLVEALAAVDKS